MIFLKSRLLAIETELAMLNPTTSYALGAQWRHPWPGLA